MKTKKKRNVEEERGVTGKEKKQKKTRGGKGKEKIEKENRVYVKGEEERGN